MLPEQKIIMASDNYEELDEYLRESKAERILLVCDIALPFLKINNYFDKLEQRLGVKVIKFDDFKPNPLYESVVKGVDIFHDNKCDLIMAVGGGSAIDVAKCIKLYSNMDKSKIYLEQDIVPNDVKLLAIPTTAGTGSEATRYAAIYYKGAKQSVTDYSAIPTTVIVDPSTLKTLPAYQKKATMMDALCHCIESYWSVNSNEESQVYSREGIKLILDNMDAYMENDDEACANMLKGANLGGKAINITQTTAGHAMCYKLTSLYGISHGHAAALCVSKLWPYMASHSNKCIDPRGEDYLKAIFEKIAEAMGCNSIQEGIECLNHILEKLDLKGPKANCEKEYEILKTSVNPVRLKNHPVKLDEDVIDNIYHSILGQDC